MPKPPASIINSLIALKVLCLVLPTPNSRKREREEHLRQW